MGITADLPPNRAAGEPAGPAPDGAEVLQATCTPVDATTTLVTVRGSVEAESVPEFYEAIDAGLRPGALTAVVDLSGVTVLASRGITVLVDAARAAKLRHVSLRLVGVQPPVQRTLDSVGLGQSFECHPTIEAALRHRPAIG